MLFRSAAAASTAKVIEGLGEKPIVIDSKRREKLLKSKKALLKLKGHGQKLVYDSDGNAHELYELEDEDDFKARGPADAQRQKFLEEEAARVAAADIEDKQTAKDKKREKKEKRKAREMADSDMDDEAPALHGGDDDDHDPIAFMKSLPMAGEESDGDEPPQKRAKKWFEDESEDEEKSAKRIAKRHGRVIEAADEPETLEDLEALAAGLLA